MSWQTRACRAVASRKTLICSCRACYLTDGSTAIPDT
uniref:Uncharacterized protein n=1 Tax=Arundo donax TaxID=35708 RepID=A0A0A9EUD8_ARUDO